MYHKFSGFTQKLTGSGPATAYSPQGLRPAVPAEAPMVFVTPTKVASVGGLALQRLFQIADGNPAHLKRGVPDRLLYRTTMALTVGGTVYCLVALYIAAQPTNK